MEVYTINQIAPILKLDTRTIQRMAEREEIPARKVGGEWRFTRLELLEWLEGRVSSTSEQELFELENTIERLAANRDVENIPVSDLLLPDAVRVPLTSRTGRGIIHEMVEVAAATNLLWDPVGMEEAVLEREAMCPTAMENGVALLHPRHPMIDILGDPFIAFGRQPSGVPFASNGMWTDLFFLICSINDTQHLRTLARLSRILTSPDFLKQLREKEDAPSVLKLFRETEAQLK
ncbi:MAG: PTS sugar transporter subunit IIA [Thermoguttaceae bacterium]|nr:PTS sugar transporter subunit IIA [Thermoguttaceae bacterium]